MLWMILLSCTDPISQTMFTLGFSDEWKQTGAIRSGTASSVYEEGSLRYTAAQACDGNHKTAWCAQKQDKQPWVEITSPCHDTLLGVIIRNGFAESRIGFSQRDRVHKATLTLSVDGTTVWDNAIVLHDDIQIQSWDMNDISCVRTYTLRLTVQDRFDNIGNVCISELQAMVSLDMEIVRGEENVSTEVPALTTLEVYAGPSTQHTLIGHAPILLTQYGSPYLRIVEERGDFVRFDRLRRRFEPQEVPPSLDDPTTGGWVHRSQLDWDLSFP